MRKLACVITVFVVFILQSSVLPFIFDEVTQPNLIFLFVVLMSLHYGQRIGVITALLGGFAQDVVIGNFFAIHLLPYILIAMICGYLCRYVEREQSLLTVLIVLGATEACYIFTWIVLVLSGQYVRIIPYLIEFSFPMLVYHGILALPVDHIVGKLHDHDMMYYNFMNFRR